MKNDQYFPHMVNVRHDANILRLVEAEGAAGYGLYWAILEYLRVQDDYKGHVGAIKTIARHMKVRSERARRVMNDYGLFVIEDPVFYSPMLNGVMEPLERYRRDNK